MEHIKEHVYLPCADNCTTLDFFVDHDGGECDWYSFSMLDCAINKKETLINRIKRAWKVLTTGSGSDFAEVVILDINDIDRFITNCANIIQKIKKE